MNYNLKEIFNRYFLAICIIGIISYLLPYLIFGQNSYIKIGDILEENKWIGSIILANNPHYIFSALGSKIPNIMNGLPRVSLGTEFSILVLLQKYFNPYTVYVLNQIIIRVIAFIGMVLLLRRHFIKTKTNINKNIIYGVSTCFAMLPFWANGILTIAGLPILSFAFFNIINKTDNIYDWIIIFFIPFLSSLQLTGVFFLFLIFILFIYDTIKEKRINYRFLISIIFLTIIYTIINYRLVINTFLNNDFISHRMEFDPSYLSVSLFGALKRSVSHFINGQYHAATLNDKFLLITTITASIIIWDKKLINKKFYVLIILMIGISIFYGFWYWEGLNGLKNKFDILRIFQFQRFHWLMPLFWYIIFALSLVIINKYIRKGYVFVYALIFLQLLYIGKEHEHIQNHNGPTFREFYAEKQMESISRYINKPKESYKVVSIGIHPAISQYNGFHTLDGYFTNYPLKYKHEFRKIIAPELNKNDKLKKYFDDWGNRCYIFVDELGKDYMYTKDRDKKIKNLDINTKKMADMGAEYILSSVEIKNYKENSLKFLHKFTDVESVWDIYLYKIVSYLDQ